jgi:hypothetical protein
MHELIMQIVACLSSRVQAIGLQDFHYTCGRHCTGNGFPVYWIQAKKDSN